MTDSIAAPQPSTRNAAPPPEPPPRPPSARSERFSFTGSTGEYFRIWIVNLFLTILTLGIYSAWAKVRKKRYLFGNTWLAGSNFEYHGRPVAILKGRLVALIAFAAYTFAARYSPRYATWFVLALSPAVPWLVVRSFAFNAVNASYRNVRFRFDGTYREALLALAPIAIIPAVTLVLPTIDPAHPPRGFAGIWFIFVTPLIAAVVYPYVVAKVRLFHANRMRFGTSPFRCDASVGSFYVIYVLAMLIFFVLVFILGAVVGVGAVFMPAMAIALAPVGYIASAAILLAFTRSRVANLTFNRTRLEGGVGLESTLKSSKLARIYGFNLAAITLTAGLAVPWAVIRTLRYRAESLAVLADDGLEAFVAGVTRDVAAAGEEMGEMFDMDFSL
jgi:uncharacterized membrane protein YjgN (DUF898 family)